VTAFVTQREFSATPQAVYGAISSAERLARWWGPEGFRNEFEHFDFQTGGSWVFTMIGPDGTRYPNEAVFTVIEAGKHVVIDHVCAPLFQLSITLQASGTGTLLTWEQVFTDPAVAQAVAHIVVPANEQNLDRLSAELASY
jgi:uncharacterized protein YndB with AHSA1/START domain